MRVHVHARPHAPLFLRLWPRPYAESSCSLCHVEWSPTGVSVGWHTQQCMWYVLTEKEPPARAPMSKLTAAATRCGLGQAGPSIPTHWQASAYLEHDARHNGTVLLSRAGRCRCEPMPKPELRGSERVRRPQGKKCCYGAAQCGSHQTSSRHRSGPQPLHLRQCLQHSSGQRGNEGSRGWGGKQQWTT
jgi:hypothetical protein